MTEDNPWLKPCIICGGTEYRFGDFVQSTTGGWARLFFQIYHPKKKQVETLARECVHCGNVQTFTRKPLEQPPDDTEKPKRKRDTP